MITRLSKCGQSADRESTAECIADGKKRVCTADGKEKKGSALRKVSDLVRLCQEMYEIQTTKTPRALEMAAPRIRGEYTNT